MMSDQPPSARQCLETAGHAVAGELSSVVVGGAAGFIISLLLLTLTLGGTGSLVVLALGLSVVVALVAAQCYRSPREDITGRVVLVTGCDTGFGNHLARTLDNMGVKVFAGCLTKARGSEEVKALEDECSSNLQTLQLDITSQQDVDDAYQRVAAEVGHRGVWGVVNNAGVSNFGGVEWCTMSMYQRCMEVNVFGAVRVTKAFLPLLRRFPGGGRVVSMASGLSRVSHPGRSAYGMSKYATEALCDCLRYEMRRWRIKVSIITPGNYLGATSIITKEGISKMADDMWLAASPEVRSAYGGRDHLDASVRAISGWLSQGSPSVSPVISAYLSALTEKSPRRRYYPTGWYWRLRIFIMSHLPEALGEWLYV